MLVDQIRRYRWKRILAVFSNDRINDWQAQGMLLRNVRHVVTGRVNGMAFVLFVPFFEICSLVHVLDDLTPTNAGVVSAEGNFAFLSAVGNHAHLGAAEVVVEKVLEPHAFNTKHS